MNMGEVAVGKLNVTYPSKKCLGREPAGRVAAGNEPWKGGGSDSDICVFITSSSDSEPPNASSLASLESDASMRRMSEFGTEPIQGVPPEKCEPV